MVPRVLRLCAALALVASAAALRAHEEWNNVHLTFNSKLTFVYPFDGRSPKVAVALLNHHAEPSLEFGFTFSVDGQKQEAGAGGFTQFPNGGTISVAPDDYGIASAWTAGVYDGRAMTPPALGETRKVTFRWDFARVDGKPDLPVADVGGDEGDETVDPPGTITREIAFTNLGDNPVLAGAFGVSGTLRFPTIAGSPAPASVVVEVATPVSPWLRVATTGTPSGAGPAFSFSTPLPQRNDWYIRFSADGYETRVFPLGLYLDPRTPFDLVLTPVAAPALDYRRIAAIATPTGFCRGAVSESEGTFVAFPGQENWKATTTDADARAVRAAGRVYKYKFDGTKLWEHTPGWEIWGGDMTPDGRFVAYALNPTRTSFYAPTENKLVLLDGTTGAVIWTKTGPVADAAVGRKLESLEVTLSPDAKWIAVGSIAGGQVTLVDRATGNFAWSAPASGPSFGQVRALRFSADSQFVYGGSGDSYLRKIRVSDGAVLWRTFIGGWPFVNGLSVSGDGQWITTGTKSLDTALVRASDGRQMWITETQVVDAVFSPDGRYIATSGGHVFRAADGSLAGMGKTPSVTRFTPDGQWLLKFDRSLALYDLGGKLLRDFGPSTIGPGSGEQAQWAHLTRDGRYAIILGRDMAAPPQTGIAIYERQPILNQGFPQVLGDPLTQTGVIGGAVTLYTHAAGERPLSYQWRRNGADLLGRNSPFLELSALSPADAGNYTCVVANAAGTVISSPAVLSVVAPDVTNPPRLTNLAVRALTGPGAQTLILGFGIGGGDSAINKRLLLRGMGPSLAPFGVTDFLVDPRLSLYAGATVVGTNDDWAGDAEVARLTRELGAFPFASTASKDAALPALPTPGAYTMLLTGAGSTTGQALAEIYDATPVFGAGTPRLTNLSARGNVTAGESLVAGFVITGQAARTVLVRAIGPGLIASFGVAGALTDPLLSIQRGLPEIAGADKWYEQANAAAIANVASQVGAFPLSPLSSDAALLLSLPPGSYTAQIRTRTGAPGNALIEVYEVP